MKLRHILLRERCYFVTTTVEGRKPLFLQEKNADILVKVAYKQRLRKRFYLFGFVVMPEHLHLMLVPCGDNTISFIMQEIKKGSARLINRERKMRRKVWMNEYYESLVRGENDFTKRMEYITNNPVKRGLAKKVEDYPYSSVNSKYETDLEIFLSGSGTTPNT